MCIPDIAIVVGIFFFAKRKCCVILVHVRASNKSSDGLFGVSIRVR